MGRRLKKNKLIIVSSSFVVFVFISILAVSGCSVDMLDYIIDKMVEDEKLIFYDKGFYSDGWRYLAAAPFDQSDGTEWGCYETEIAGADGTAIGTGKQNTTDIEVGCSTTGTASDICAHLTLGSYSNWFLPSKDELNLMYINLHEQGIGDFVDDRYWSSSEGNVYRAWEQDFSDGIQDTEGREPELRVRAIRAY